MLDAFDAGERFMFLYNVDAGPQHSDSKTELAVALKNEALTANPDVLKSFTFVDFIVTSMQMKDSIQSRGIGSLSSDVMGNYSTSDKFIAYVAASIPFNYFCNQTKLPSSVNEANFTLFGGEETIVKFIIGDGFCPPKIPTACQNGQLRENAEYLYVRPSS